MCTGKNLARIYNTALHLYWKTSISAYIWIYYLQIHFDSFKFADANHAIWVKCCRLDDATEYNERKRQRIYICVCVYIKKHSQIILISCLKCLNMVFILKCSSHSEFLLSRFNLFSTENQLTLFLFLAAEMPYLQNLMLWMYFQKLRSFSASINFYSSISLKLQTTVTEDQSRHGFGFF